MQIWWLVLCDMRASNEENRLRYLQCAGRWGKVQHGLCLLALKLRFEFLIAAHQHPRPAKEHVSRTGISHEACHTSNGHWSLYPSTPVLLPGPCRHFLFSPYLTLFEQLTSELAAQTCPSGRSLGDRSAAVSGANSSSYGKILAWAMRISQNTNQT